MKGRTKTVLVVDPNEATLHTFKRLLKNQGFVVDEATKDEEAMAKMESQSYDLVLVSSLLPDTDGMDLFLFTKESVPKAKDIVTKGFPFSSEAITPFKSEADVIFAKPVAPDQLLRVIEKLQSAARANEYPRAQNNRTDR